MADNILTKDRADADISIAAKDNAGVLFPRNIIVTPEGLDLSPLTDGELRASPVPVSAAALPLPSGAATETTLAAANAKLPALESGRIPVVLPADPIQTNDDESGGLLRRILALLMSPRGYDKAQARQRGTVVVESLPTLATVTTVGNITSIAGRDAVMLINPTNRTSWALNHRSRIT